MIKLDDAIDLLKVGAVIEQKKTSVSTKYFLQLDGKFVDSVYPQTFHALQSRNILENVGFRDHAFFAGFIPSLNHYPLNQSMWFSLKGVR